MATSHNPVRLDDYSEPVPDFMVLAPRLDAYADSHPCPADVRLLVEVTDVEVTDCSLDHTRNKLAHYAGAGIREVWIVDCRATIRTRIQFAVGTLIAERPPHR